MQIQRILCPVDFSKESRHAIDQAVLIAGYYHSRITGLHAVTPLALAETVAGTFTEEASEIGRLRRLVLDEVGARAGPGVPVDALVEIGQPASVILECSTKLPADLVVMGTHGTSGFQHLVLGSTTEKVLRKAQCPVLTVPPHPNANSQLPFKRLLCAVDFSETSLGAVEWVLSLARESAAAVTLLHVLEWPWQEPPPPHIEDLPSEQGLALAEFRRYSEERAKSRLESLIPDSMPRSQAVTRLRSGKPYVQILEAAAGEQSDLIVIGVHGRNPVDLGLFGSTTNQVVRRATCPVLTLRR